jgi:hypothetical protein
MAMPPMLAYTINGTLSSGAPYIAVGQGPSRTYIKCDTPADDSYWICILDANKPTQKVKEFVIPGVNNSTVPNGLDTYLSNPAYIFALVTQNLGVVHVPQGALYNYLVQHGAGRELQRLEQINTSIGCGSIGNVSYLLTAQGGSSVGYEQGLIRQPVMLLMSFMPRPDGTPPYSICDSNTFNT